MAYARARITSLLSMNLFFSGVAFAATAPYRAVVGIEYLGLSNTFYAVVMTLSAVGAAIASVFLGALSDNIRDRRWLVLLCAFAGVIGFGFIYVRPTALSYVLCFCLLIPFANAFFSQCFSYARALYDKIWPERAEFLNSCLRTLFTAAWVIVPPVAAWLAASISPFSVFALAAVAHVICTALVGLLLLDPGSSAQSAVKRRDTQDSDSPAPTPVHASHLVGILGVLFIKVAMALHITILPLATIRDLNGSLSDVGIIASFAALLEVPFMIGWGLVAMRMRKEWILAFNAIVYAVYMALFSCARSISDVLLLQVLNAVATAALMSITISYMQDVIKNRVGLSTSLMDVVNVASVMLAAVVFALLAREQSYLFVFVAAAVQSLLGAVLVWASQFLKGARAETAVKP